MTEQCVCLLSFTSFVLFIDFIAICFTELSICVCVCMGGGVFLKVVCLHKLCICIRGCTRLLCVVWCQVYVE